MAGQSFGHGSDHHLFLSCENRPHFVADAFQHCKYIGYDNSALPLLEKAGIAGSLDEGTLALPGEDGIASFVAELGKLRVWGREPSVKLGKASTPLS